MTCRVVTIARSTGAEADRIGPAVATQLGYRFVDEEILALAAQRAGLTRQIIEDQERSHSLVAQVLSAMSAVLASAPEVQLPKQDAWDDPSSAYRRLIQNVIEETAAQGHVVIAAHGAGIHLAGTAGLLRVLLTASPATRVRRLAAAAGLDDASARRQIVYSDRERRAYLARFDKVRDELPTHYDLVINTDVLPPAIAVQVIVGAASAMD